MEAGHTYYYIVTATDTLGSESGYSGQEEAEVGVKVAGNLTGLPRKTSLSQNFPNPFNPTTLIRYQLSAGPGRPVAVTLVIYNILGQEVRTLVCGDQAPGYYAVRWDGDDDLGREVASGLYLCRLEAGECSLTRKLLLLR